MNSRTKGDFIMKKTLGQQLAFNLAIAICGGVFMHAFYLILTGEKEPLSLLFQDLTQALGLGLLVYGFLLLHLRSCLLKPLDMLHSHARDMSRGVFYQCDYLKTKNQIDQITSAMNSMARHLNKMKNAAWTDYAEVIKHHLTGRKNRDILPPDVQNELMQIGDCLGRMEAAMPVSMKRPPWSTSPTATFRETRLRRTPEFLTA